MLIILAKGFFVDANVEASYTVKKCTRFLDFFYQTFLGLERGTLFPAWESFVSDIPAGDGNIAKLFLQCETFPH